MKKNNIAFLGPIGSGKDTAAQIMAAILAGRFENRVKKSFAGKLKKMVSVLTDIPLTEYTAPAYTEPFMDFTREEKMMYLEEWGMTLGQMLQRLGTEGMRDAICPEVHIIGLQEGLDENYLNMITDARFFNEVKYFHDRDDAIVIKIEREENPFDDSDKRDSSHRSESDMERIGPSMFDAVVKNDGDLLDLFDKIADIAVELGLVEIGDVELCHREKITKNLK